MARRKKHAEHANHERWLVSYADFITLLFAFFVVMFATSKADKGKVQQVSESVRRALEEGFVATKMAAVLGGTAGDTGQGNALKDGPGGARAAKRAAGRQHVEPSGAVVAELLPSLEHLTQELDAEIRAGKLQIALQPRGLVVSLSQAAFFPSGEDAIEPTTYDTIGKIVAAIQPLPNPVRLEGHTDNVPIHNSRFRSNWELSTARGIAMLELLTRRFAIPAARLAVAGYAEYVPASPNDSNEGRAKNRRVDIVILNQRGVLREPPPMPTRAATA